MKFSAKIVGLMGMMFALPLLGEEVKVTSLDLKSLDFALPQALQLRAEMAALEEPEFVESLGGLGLGDFEDSRTKLSSWVQVYRAEDGLTYLVDQLHMALWVRGEKAWRCVVPSLRVDKTMGGRPPWMPVRYLGAGLFAVSETVPGKVTELSAEGFPQARAVTFLIDSNNGGVKERSKSFVYDHNPPIVIPKEWVSQYQIESKDSE